ncbi:hypothetical protein Tco_1001649 [Tanacetum coccineum]
MKEGKNEREGEEERKKEKLLTENIEGENPTAEKGKEIHKIEMGEKDFVFSKASEIIGEDGRMDALDLWWHALVERAES